LCEHPQHHNITTHNSKLINNRKKIKLNSYLELLGDLLDYFALKNDSYGWKEFIFSSSKENSK
jgi:hypothetical protein